MILNNQDGVLHGSSQRAVPLPTKRPLAPLMLLMAACSSPALAEDAARKDDPLELGADTVTGEQASSRVERSASAKYAVPLLDTPQTVTVVPQKVIQEQNALSLRQVLSNVSGITFNAGEGGGGSGDSINIRGFSANANMQVDGLRDSAQTSRSDLFNLEAVEVIKGPNSVFGGAGTSGGSINMVSKQPKAEAFTHLGAGLGTDRYRRLTLDTNQPLEGLGESTAFRLNLMAHHNDVAGREQIDKQRWGIAPSLTFGLDTPTRLTLSYFHQRDDNLPDYGVPALNGRKLDGVSRHDYFGWRNLDEERIDNDVATLKLEHDFSDDFQLQNLIRYSHLHRDTVISASHVNQKGLPPGRYLPAGPQAYGRDSKTRMWINQTNLTGRFDTFGLAHTLIGGFELSRETYDRTTYSYNLGKFYPANGFDLHNPPGYWNGPTDKRDSARNRTELEVKALYAFDTIALDERWDLSLGLRYDWIDGTSRARLRQADGARRQFRRQAEHTGGAGIQAAGERAGVLLLRHLLQPLGGTPGHHRLGRDRGDRRPGAGEEQHLRAGHQVGVPRTAPGAGRGAVPGEEGGRSRTPGRRQLRACRRTARAWPGAERQRQAERALGPLRHLHLPRQRNPEIQQPAA